MTAETATINLNALAATAIFASTEETRYYLNGVLLEIEPDAITYVATDGHRLFSHRDDTVPKGGSHTLLGKFIIPTSACKAIKPTRRPPHATLVSDEGKRLVLDHFGNQHVFEPIDGTYPDWRAVARTTKAAKRIRLSALTTLSFNWAYVASFEKAAKILDLGQAAFVPRGEDKPASIWFSRTDTFGLVMPVRGGGDWSTRPMPTWAMPPASPASAKAA